MNFNLNLMRVWRNWDVKNDSDDCPRIKTLMGPFYLRQLIWAMACDKRKFAICSL